MAFDLWRCARTASRHAASLSTKPRASFFHSNAPRRNAAAAEQGLRAKQTARLTPTMILLGITPFVTFALGTWQIQRLKWKIDLIDELHEKLQRAPIDLPDYVNTEVLDNFAFRKVKVKGRWDHAHTILIGPRVRDGAKGVNVITPLNRSDGSTILVDRGFISDEQAASKPWTTGAADEEEVQLVGMIRLSQKRNTFTPDNHPEKGEWYWVDVKALADFAGGEAAGVQPVFVEQIFEGHSGDAQLCVKRGVPVGRAPTVEVRNSHAAYVLTWYSLSALTTVMFFMLWKKRARAPAARMPRN